MSQSQIESLDLNREGVKSGDILVPMRLITTSALLLDIERSPLPLDEGRFLDLCTFISALAFHDRILTLPIDEITPDVMNTELFSYLTDKKEGGILKLLNRENIEERLKSENIKNSLHSKTNSKLKSLFGDRAFGQDTNMYLDKERYEIYTRQEKTISDKERHNFIDEIIKKTRDATHELPIVLYKQDEEAFLWRTAFYLAISEVINLPFIPDFTRIPILAKYQSTIHGGLKMYLQGKVTEHETKKLLDYIIPKEQIYLPNPVMDFLRQYSDRENRI